MSLEINSLWNQMTDINKSRLAEYARTLLDKQQAIITIKFKDPDHDPSSASFAKNTIREALDSMVIFETEGADTIITDRTGAVRHRFTWFYFNNATGLPCEMQLPYGARPSKDGTGYWLEQHLDMDEYE